MGRRKNIWDLGPGERASLVAAIQEYVTPDIMKWHADHHDLHTSGYFFLTGHRQYLEGLEAFLRNAGKLGPAELLPNWDPSDRQSARRLIPPEFIIPSNGPDRIHNIYSLLRPVIAFSFFPFKGFWRRLWPPFPFPHPSFVPWKSLFGIVLCWTSHFAVHVLVGVGGKFAKIPQTPETPLFWIWHAFIDDLYWDWEQAHPSPHAPHVH